MIEFYAVGIPKGQPRPRAFSRGGHARVFDPGTAEIWKSDIAAAVRDKLPAQPLEGPLHVDMKFYFPRPKSHFTKKGKRPEAPKWQTGKPDADNLAKAVLDALTILRVWNDDTQVCKLDVRKFYNDTACPGALIRIQSAQEA
jgi:Holliday junction resolvase RusA-like endonuclease